MTLYRREWQRVRDRLMTIKTPTPEMQTLASRVDEMLARSLRDPLFLAITDGQTDWIEKWCHYVTIHKRPEEGR